jgi:hypothetical protein
MWEVACLFPPFKMRMKYSMKSKSQITHIDLPVTVPYLQGFKPIYENVLQILSKALRFSIFYTTHLCMCPVLMVDVQFLLYIFKIFLQISF